jgi:hypothetical protein
MAIPRNRRSGAPDADRESGSDGVGSDGVGSDGVGSGGVAHDAVAADAEVIEKLSAGCIEDVGDREVDVFVLGVSEQVLAAGNGQGELDLERGAATAMAMREVDPDVAALDAVVDALESLDGIGDDSFDRRAG